MTWAKALGQESFWCSQAVERQPVNRNVIEKSSLKSGWRSWLKQDWPHRPS